MAFLKRPDVRLHYGGSWFVAASALPLDGGLARPGRLANLFAAALLRPGHALALIALLFRTRSERLALSGSLTGQALNAYFDERSLGVFPQNRLCRGVLILPEHHSEYLRGRHRQALRTNLRRAENAGIRCESISDPQRAFDEVTEILMRRQLLLTPDEQSILASWPAILAAPEMTLIVARDQHGQPLALTGAVIDDAVCLIRLAVASNHEARWALHDHLVQILIARAVGYLLGDGGGPFGALGFDSNVHHYQRLLGYELRHVRPGTSRPPASAESPAVLSRDLTAVAGPRQPSAASSQVEDERAA